MALEELSHIGSYTLLSKLGEGRFGVVWLARHHELPIDRAIKIATDIQYVRYLRQEAKIQFLLRHPHIVETFDLSTAGDPPHVVMEYVPGLDLRKHIRDRQRLSVEQALPLLNQILQALVEAHRHSVLHRDLKPENVMITPNGLAKVTDFGLGKIQTETSPGSILLTSDLQSGANDRSLAGTLEYMSPEQRRGEEADASDDVYAVGVMCCEMLTGSRPSGVGVGKLCERAGIRGNIVEILENALDERRYRYSSAQGILNEISAAVGDSSAVQVPILPPPTPKVRIPPLQVSVPSGETLTNSIGMHMVAIPPGEFLMGASTSDRRFVGEQVQTEHNILYDCAQHRVRLTRQFFLAVIPVTQAQWNKIMWRNPSQLRNDDHPVDSVTWHAASDFCARLTRKEGRRYRLPTEAEWEYACRAGTLSAFNIGDDADPDSCAWHAENSEGRTRPPGKRVPNKWGLFDMHGNVWEWCQDAYADYLRDDAVDPYISPGSKSAPRVLRGGSCCRSLSECMSSVRLRLEPDLQSSSIGVRVVLEDDDRGGYGEIGHKP